MTCDVCEECGVMCDMCVVCDGVVCDGVVCDGVVRGVVCDGDVRDGVMHEMCECADERV